MTPTELAQAKAPAAQAISPAYRDRVEQARKAFDDDSDLRKHRLHHTQNDATACVKVSGGLPGPEWGTEGHFQMRNTCGYPISVSWCANTNECSAGHGSLWTLAPDTTWPIFFADPDNPAIQIGACRTEADSVPWPSTQQINRQGGVNTRHDDPQPATGVSRMNGHTCK